MRVNDLESAVAALQRAYETGKIITDIEKFEEGDGGWIIVFSDNSTIALYNGAKGENGEQGDDGDAFFSGVDIQEEFVTFVLIDGTTFTFRKTSNIVAPKLVSMEFRSSVNPTVLIEDVACTISDDGMVECWIRHTVDSKLLTPHFTFDGDCVVDAEGEEVISDDTLLDFKSPLTLTVKSGSFSKEYTIYVHSFTGLPVLWIDTENGVEIASKDTYVNAHFTLVEDIVESSSNSKVEYDGQIKGRGNSTWSAPKKPYRIKFNSKESILGEPKDKSWVLLANWYDKTLIRNTVAFYMGSISNLDYTPRFHYVDLMLNGEYNGTYQLGDHLKISKNRVNVGDDGFLVEIDCKLYDSDARYFYVPHIDYAINIKDPDVEFYDDNYTYVANYINMVDNVLFSDDFKDPDNGWQKYMDIDSFVDWFLINELAKNPDAQFSTSCFMNLKRGGKLCMGPLWDFDLGFGNYWDNETHNNPEGFYIKNVSWYIQLFKDPAFISRTKERFYYFFNHKADIMNNINMNAQYIKESVIRNDGKWGNLKTGNSANYDVWETYMEEVQKLKSWISKRFDWLKGQFDSM